MVSFLLSRLRGVRVFSKTHSQGILAGGGYHVVGNVLNRCGVHSARCFSFGPSLYLFAQLSLLDLPQCLNNCAIIMVVNRIIFHFW